MKRWHRWLASGASLFGTTAVNCVIVPAAVGGVTMMVLATHEYAHFFAAHTAQANPDPPLFIPLGYLAFGWVRTDDGPASGVIAIAGPIAGLITAFALTLSGFILGAAWLCIAGLVGIAFEVWSMTAGGDGRRYRTTKENRWVS